MRIVGPVFYCCCGFLLGRYEEGRSVRGFGLCCFLSPLRLASLGVLWFVLDIWAIDRCPKKNRGARFKWLAAWNLIFGLVLMVGSPVLD